MEHRFTVPVPVDEAWRVLLDPHQVAECFPGASLDSVDGDSFAGSVKVRLGPISLLYKGKGQFVERDEGQRSVAVEASGKDSRGNGTAKASVSASMSEESGVTAVRVTTDLSITGKPAQMGRGMFNDVAGKLLDQFSECLATRLGRDSASDSPRHDTDQATSGDQAPQADAKVAEPSAVQRADAVDLLDTAGVPVLKRLAPIAVVLIGVAVFLRRRRKRRRTR